MSTLNNNLIDRKINQLFYDALMTDDILTMLELLNNHYYKVYLSLISKKLKNGYIIDYIVDKLIVEKVLF